MAKFKRGGHGARQGGQEFVEHPGIGLEVRRQLEKHRAEFARLRQRFEGAEEARHEFFRVLQPLDVSDDLMGFDAEAEIRRESAAIHFWMVVSFTSWRKVKLTSTVLSWVE